MEGQQKHDEFHSGQSRVPARVAGPFIRIRMAGRDRQRCFSPPGTRGGRAFKQFATSRHTMSTAPISVLLVEDSPSDAALLQESLNGCEPGQFQFTHVETLTEGVAQLLDRRFDVLLLDLSLPDVAGRETFLRARAEAPHLPIVVLTGGGNEALGLEAVRHGIQDFLIKGQTHGRQTARAIRYAMEHKRVEEALATASEQRRLTLEAADMGAWDYRFDTGEVLWDERCRNQWGIAEGGQIDYARAIAAIHPEDRAATDEAVKRALAGADDGAYHGEFRVVWPDGSVHWIGSRGQVYFKGEGERRRAVRFIGANLDITERKGMEEVQVFLLRSGHQNSGESFFQALARFLAQSLGMDFVCIDHLEGDGLAVRTLAMHFDGKFEDNVAYALKDTPCGEVAGQTICCFPRDVRHLFPKDAVLQKMRAESYVGTTLWSFDGKPIGLIAVIGRKPLATSRLAESVLKLVAAPAAGELERMLAERALRRAHDELELRVKERTTELQQTNEQMRREIEVRRQTEQQLSEAEMRYRTVADFTYDWEYWKTPEGLLLYCSPSCERITGYTPSELAVSSELLIQMIHPQDREHWQQHERETMAQPALGSLVFRIQRKDGELRWIEHFCRPVIGGQGEFLGVRASNRDVTERKQTETDRQRLQEELAYVTRVSTVG